jgi:hypothetical protein
MLAREYLMSNLGADDDMWQVVDDIESTAHPKDISKLHDRFDYSALIHQHQLLTEGYGWLSYAQCRPRRQSLRSCRRLLGDHDLVLLRV